MKLDTVGLIISAASSSDDSAYSERLRRLAQGLERTSIRCDFFWLPDNPPLHKVTPSSLLLPFWLKTLRHYDFIHCGHEEAGQAMFLCRPFLRNLIIYDVHGDATAQSALANETRSGGRRHSASLRVRLFERMALTSADHILTVSHLQSQALVASGVGPERITLVRNGVDLDLFPQLSQPQSPEFTFGYVGEFQSWQGIENLIEACRMMGNQGVKMLIVGFRPQDRALKERFRSTFGPRVELVDRTVRSDIIERLRSVSVLLIPRIRHPAIRHAFPTKFAEYAALGRPILVNDVDETADFVRRYDCGFVAQPSPREMAAKMDEVATCSPTTLVRMGRRARQMAEEHFSWDGIGAVYGCLIRRLLSVARKMG